MKVYIGPYTEWFGPYQLAEKLLFWLDKYHDNRVHRFGMWLAGDKDINNSLGKRTERETLLYKFFCWIDSKKSRTVKIRIDKYDTWNMDRTLALIILPMLKQLKETKHGSQCVDLEDVPEHLRFSTTEDYDSQLTFDFYSKFQIEEGKLDVHARWDWVMDEIIWAFEQHQPDYDWEEQYFTGETDYHYVKTERTYPNPLTNEEEHTYQMVTGPNHTQKIDFDGLQRHRKRIDNGFRLFGKYYAGLWD